MSIRFSKPVIAFALLLFGGLLCVALLTSVPSELVLEVSSARPDDVHRVFLDLGRGYRKGVTISARNRFSGCMFESLKFSLPMRSIKNLRLDPGTTPGTVRIRSIRLTTPLAQHTWPAESVIEDFVPRHHIKSYGVTDGVVTLVSSGNDPILAFRGDFEGLRTHLERRTRLLLLLVSVLLAAVAHLILSRWRNVQSWIQRNSNGAALALFAVLTFGLLVQHGHLWMGPRIVDENQVFRLQEALASESFLGVLMDEQETRFESYRRFVPAYLVQKVAAAQLFGADLRKWSASIGVIGTLSAFLLFRFGRIIGFSAKEAVAFSLLTVLGKQSVVWWKLFHGEGLGMLFLALSLTFMAKGVVGRTHRQLYTALFLCCALVMSLCKESFILMLPGLALWRALLVREHRGVSLWTGLRRSAVVVVFLLALCAAELLIIRYGLQTTQFHYAGWQGFDVTQFMDAVGQFFRLTGGWVIGLTGLIIYLSTSGPFWERHRRIWLANTLTLGLLVAAIVLPQLLLHMKSGFYLEGDQTRHYARYLLPGSIGVAYGVICLARQLRSVFRDERADWQAASASGVGGSQAAQRYQSALMSLVTLAIAAHLGVAGVAAYRESLSYREYSRQVTDWLTAIERNTSKSDTIVVLHGEGSVAVPVRVDRLLSGMLGLRDVFFSPGISAERIGMRGSGGRVADIARHAGSLRSVREMPKGRQINAVVIVEDMEAKGVSREKDFVTRHGEWCDSARVLRYANGIGLKALFRCSAVAEAPAAKAREGTRHSASWCS